MRQKTFRSLIVAALIFFTGGATTFFAASAVFERQAQEQLVKATVIKHFDTLTSLSLLPSELQRELGMSANPQAAKYLHVVLGEVFAAEEAAKVERNLIDLFAKEEGQFPYPTWTAAREVVSEWKSIQVSSNEATLDFISHVEYVSQGKIESRQVIDWTVKMTRSEGGRWLIRARTGKSLSGNG